MLEFHEEANGKLLIVKMSGKLTKEDYEHFLPEVERLIEQHGKIRVLCHMDDFHGWELGALREDVEFDIKHFAVVERLALVDKKWQARMATFCNPFTTATVQYYNQSEFEMAVKWLCDDLPNSEVEDARAFVFG